MKIALVHDLLVKLWWAEKVLEKLLQMYPEADLFTLIYDEKKVEKVFPKSKIKHIPSITQNIFKLTKNQRFCLPFMSRAVESLDLSEYDVVIADNSAFVHGCITKPETKFIVYYHTPARYMWDRTNEYKKEIWWNSWIKKAVLNYMLKWLRTWDFQASQRHDITLCNSFNVAKRLKKYYKLDSQVVYPNVWVERFDRELETTFEKPFWHYYIIVSALTEFKNISIAIEAFNQMTDKNLVIVWAWNYSETLKSQIKAFNIKMVWRKYDDELVYLMQNASWLVFAWEEDFWIVPIEAMACWIPVFAYKWGGLEETMIEWVTWEFFLDIKGWDFASKFIEFDKQLQAWKYNPNLIKRHAYNYSSEVFEEKIRSVVGE